MVQVPAVSLTLSQIWKACQEVAAEEKVSPLGKVSVGALPEGATVKELNVCPAVDISKAVSLGLPNNVSIHEIIRDYINVHIKPKQGNEPSAKKARTCAA